jgi:phosphate transport system ATP-binding protein
MSIQRVTDVVKVIDLNAWFGPQKVLNGIHFTVQRNEVAALIGPSGCGKSTFIRCLNRLHEEVPSARVEGEVWLDGVNIYEPGSDPVAIRRRVGMVFQKPNPFPGMSIYDNVAVGLRLTGLHRRSMLDQKVEGALKAAALWQEVKEKLKAPGTSLSGGQQQRLCIARALAVDPSIILMDEPTSALDPISTAKIEELITELKKSITVVIVTHNMQQASRISDKTAFFLIGQLVEYGETSKLFTKPRDTRTEQYITGRFG